METKKKVPLVCIICDGQHTRQFSVVCYERVCCDAFLHRRHPGQFEDWRMERMLLGDRYYD